MAGEVRGSCGLRTSLFRMVVAECCASRELLQHKVVSDRSGNFHRLIAELRR
jgi:hypothetical protein